MSIVIPDSLSPAMVSIILICLLGSFVNKTIQFLDPVAVCCIAHWKSFLRLIWLPCLQNLKNFKSKSNTTTWRRNNSKCVWIQRSFIPSISHGCLFLHRVARGPEHRLCFCLCIYVCSILPYKKVFTSYYTKTR